MSPWLRFDREFPKYEAVDTARSVEISQWESLLPGYVACVDEPASYYWKQLWESFPDALVILSTRDPASWYESVKSITRQIRDEKSQSDRLTPQRREYLDFLYALYPNLDQEDSTREEDIGYFIEHNEKVVSYAESNGEFSKRLLVWRPGDGWEPICEALGLPVPDIEFPHSNRRSEYHGY